VGAFPDPKPVKFGRYILLDRINVGGMAEVFRGKTAGVEGFERMVALKRILPNIAADPDFIEMFVDEAKLAVQLQHANIAQIFDLGKVDEQYYISMEYVSGVDLRTMWDRARQRNRLLPIAMSCHVIQKACEGLDAAHRKKDQSGVDIGLVHRDVSPQNILISFEGEVKVIDFGIAKAANKVSKTQAGVLKGKFGYMSPEQVRGVDLDNRSDIFAIGVVLYELLVGDRLFLGESDFSTLEKVRNVEMVPPTRLNKNLSPHLERIVMKALAKNREDRYRFASEMAEDLQRYLFSTNQPFARTDLQKYMQQHFKEELEREQERLDKYKTITFDQFETEETQHGDSPYERMPTAAGVPPLKRQAPTVTPSAQRATPSNVALRETVQPVQPAMQPQYAPMHPQMQMPYPPMPPPVKPRVPAWIAGLIGAMGVILIGVVGLLVYKIQSKPATGSVEVDVKPPDAEILLNDKLIANKAPFTIDLEAGSYVVRVKAPGYKEVIRPVRVESGVALQESFVLEQENGKGSIIVETEPPGLIVYLDGKPTGKVTPATIEDLRAGSYEVRLERDDKSIVHKGIMSIEESEPGRLSIDTRKLKPILMVSSVPEGAKVVLDGEAKGTTPLTIPGLRSGRSIAVVLEKPGCKPYQESVPIRAATLSLVEATLDCQAEAAVVPEPAGTGKINVTATAVAEVFIDGRSFGQTPRFNMEVPAGKRLLRLVPTANHIQPWETELVIEAGTLQEVSHNF
jgi:serine/threonine protein kinase